MPLQIGRCYLKQILRRKGMTQQQLADRMGVTKGMISQYATRSRVMSLLTAKQIASLLNITVEELYEWKEL